VFRQWVETFAPTSREHDAKNEHENLNRL